jgi:hypothetical protein
MCGCVGERLLVPALTVMGGATSGGEYYINLDKESGLTATI